MSNLADFTEEQLISEVKNEVLQQLKQLEKKVVYLSSGENQSLAKDILQRREVKERICASLNSFSGDLWDMVKIVTPIFLKFELAGTLIIPTPNKVAFLAFIVLTIFIKVGISAYCS